jgi:hypothetical protein
VVYDATKHEREKPNRSTSRTYSQVSHPGAHSSAARHHSVQDPFGRVPSGVFRRTVSTSISDRLLTHVFSGRQIPQRLEQRRGDGWHRVRGLPVRGLEVHRGRLRGEPSRLRWPSLHEPASRAVCGRVPELVPQAARPHVARQLIHFGTGPLVTANWPAQRHRRGRTACWGHRSTSRHRWTSQALRPISIGPASSSLAP